MKGETQMRSPTAGCADPPVENAADRMPNSDTIEAIQQVEAGEDLVEYSDMDQYMEAYASYRSYEPQNE